MPRKGQQHTVWARDKISRELTGRKLSKEHKRNLSKAKMGHEVSAATKRKMSKTRTGMKLSKQHCENISKGHKGKIVSKDTRENMSRAAFKREKKHRVKKRWGGLMFWK